MNLDSKIIIIMERAKGLAFAAYNYNNAQKILDKTQEDVSDEDYLVKRIHNVLDSYYQQYLKSLAQNAANQELYLRALSLSPEKLEAIKALISQ